MNFWLPSFSAASLHRALAVPHWCGFGNYHFQSLLLSGMEGGKEGERKEKRMERRKKTMLHKQLQTL